MKVGREEGEKEGSEQNKCSNGPGAQRHGF